MVQPTASKLNHELLNPYHYRGIGNLGGLQSLAELLEASSNWSDMCESINSHPLVQETLNYFRSISPLDSEATIKYRVMNGVILIYHQKSQLVVVVLTMELKQPNFAILRIWPSCSPNWRRDSKKTCNLLLNFQSIGCQGIVPISFERNAQIREKIDSSWLFGKKKNSLISTFKKKNFKNDFSMSIN